jgi:branched-subunit amino acid transport protein AzlD
VLLAIETVGVAIIIWRGVPIYQLIAKNPRPQDLDLQTVVLALVAALLVQAAYWLRQALIPTLKFTSIIVLSHLILFAGRLSFVFGTSMFSVIVYQRLPTITISPYRFSLLALVLFSLFCYTRELEELGRSLGTRSRE